MSLLDAVQAQEVNCKVPGCSRKWTLTAVEVVAGWKKGKGEPPKRMCEPCREKFQNLKPLEMKCSTKDCEGVSKVEPYQQLILGNKRRPLAKETFFCDECTQFMKEIGKKAVPCRIKTCDKTWTWFPASQLKTGGRNLKHGPEQRLCDSCYKELQELDVAKRPCRVKGCTEHWTLDRMTQIDLKARGKKEPKRMCTRCSKDLKDLGEMAVPCKQQGCGNTWNWAPYSQLEFARAKDSDPALELPARHCERCFQTNLKLKPVSVPCLKEGCPHNLEYSTEDQLSDIVAGRKAKPERALCKTCKTHKEALLDKQMPCKQEGCDKSWVWPAADQFQAGTYHKGKFQISEPQKQFCVRCAEFGAGHPDAQVPCTECGTGILWTTRQQLMTELGKWAAPGRCPECLKKSR